MRTSTRKRTPPEVRFWRHVDIKGEDDCWEWTSGKGPHGHGSFTLSKGCTVLAYRFSYELANGPIPEGLYVLHDCDNPACVNPAHLTAGTQKKNIRDAVRRGRWMTEKRKAHLARLAEKNVTHGRRRGAKANSGKRDRSWLEGS